MKKLILLFILCFVTPAFAEEIISLPIAVVVSEPVTDTIAVQRLVLYFDNDPAKCYAEIDYTVYNPSKTIPLVKEEIYLRDADYSAFVLGIINPLKNRRDAAIQADIEAKLPVVPKP